MAEKDFRRNERLHNSQTIADKALEESEQRWLVTQESYEALRSEISQDRVQVADLEREWQRFATQHTQEGEQLLTNLITRVSNLKSAISKWEELYLLTAPRAGTVSFTDFWSEQQSVQTGQTVMSIVPALSEKQVETMVIGQLRVPVQSSGKLLVGQTVEVYLESYPYAEYGKLFGVVQRILILPKRGQYHLIITFPNGLTTQYGIVIPFQQQLQGKGEVITADLRLVERLLYNLRKAKTAGN